MLVKTDSAWQRGRYPRLRDHFTGRILQVMPRGMHLNPWNILLIAIAGWMNLEQAAVVEHHKEENRIPRELPGKQRPRLNDDRGRRLAAKGQALVHCGHDMEWADTHHSASPIDCNE